MSLSDEQKLSIMRRDPRYARVWPGLYRKYRQELAASKPRVSVEGLAGRRRH